MRRVALGLSRFVDQGEAHQTWAGACSNHLVGFLKMASRPFRIVSFCGPNMTSKPIPRQRATQG